jgi:hypothetical protein
MEKPVHFCSPPFSSRDIQTTSFQNFSMYSRVIIIASLCRPGLTGSVFETVIHLEILIRPLFYRPQPAPKINHFGKWKICQGPRINFVSRLNSTVPDCHDVCDTLVYEY